MTEIITQAIIGACTILGTIITCIANNKTMVWRIEQLEKKVDKHNNVIERVYKLEQKINDMEVTA